MNSFMYPLEIVNCTRQRFAQMNKKWMGKNKIKFLYSLSIQRSVFDMFGCSISFSFFFFFFTFMPIFASLFNFYLAAIFAEFFFCHTPTQPTVFAWLDCLNLKMIGLFVSCYSCRVFYSFLCNFMSVLSTVEKGILFIVSLWLEKAKNM